MFQSKLRERLLVLLGSRPQGFADVVVVDVEADLADAVVLGLGHAGDLDRKSGPVAPMSCGAFLSSFS